MRLEIVIAVVIASGAGFFTGGYANETLMEPEVIEMPVEVVKWKEPEKEVIYLDAEPIIETVELPVEIPIKLRNFENTEELESWLEDNYIDHADMGYISGKPFDCDDYALRLIKDARRDGYEMYLQVLMPRYRRPDNNKLVTHSKEAHAVCSVIIGDNLYFIEPQTDEYWLAAKVD